MGSELSKYQGRLETQMQEPPYPTDWMQRDPRNQYVVYRLRNRDEAGIDERSRHPSADQALAHQYDTEGICFVVLQTGEPAKKFLWQNSAQKKHDIDWVKRIQLACIANGIYVKRPKWWDGPVPERGDTCGNEWIDGYHQTDKETAALIQLGGNGAKFQPGSRGSLGPGIYFATTAEDTHGKALSSGVIFHCRICPGRAKITERWDPSMTIERMESEGWDCIYIQGRKHGQDWSDASTPEYKIWDPRRIQVIRRQWAS